MHEPRGISSTQAGRQATVMTVTDLTLRRSEGMRGRGWGGGGRVGRAQGNTCDLEGGTFFRAESKADASGESAPAAPSSEVPHSIVRPHQG